MKSLINDSLKDSKANSPDVPDLSNANLDDINGELVDDYHRS